jgi:hypothetical protein
MSNRYVSERKTGPSRSPDLPQNAEMKSRCLDIDSHAFGHAEAIQQ